MIIHTKADSTLDADLLRAYLETGYRVHTHDTHGTPAVVLRIGERSDALLRLHRDHGVASSAFVTAWNPNGRELAECENVSRQIALRNAVREHCWHTIEGTGQHPRSGWHEESLLVLGPSLDEARQLGGRFAQNAVVWTGEDGVPRLVVLC